MQLTLEIPSVSLDKIPLGYQKRLERTRYFSDLEKGTGEWNNILSNIVSSRVDKEELPLWNSNYN